MAVHLGNLALVLERLGRSNEAANLQHELTEFNASDPTKKAIDARLASIVDGKDKPKDNAERLELAYRAYDKSLFATSAKLFTEALENDRTITGDGRSINRYNAACSAVLAASGRGKDETQADDGTKVKFRQQAIGWLEAELAASTKSLESGSTELKTSVLKMLDHWKKDADLSSIRDEKELAKLPDVERAAFAKLWSKVDQLLGLAQNVH